MLKIVSLETGRQKRISDHEFLFFYSLAMSEFAEDFIGGQMHCSWMLFDRERESWR